MGAIESNTKKLTEVEDAPSGYRIVGIAAAASAATFRPPSSSVRSSSILEGSIDGTTGRMADDEDAFPAIARLRLRRSRSRRRRRRRPPPSFVRNFPQPDVLVDVRVRLAMSDTFPSTSSSSLYHRSSSIIAPTPPDTMMLAGWISLCMTDII